MTAPRVYQLPDTGEQSRRSPGPTRYDDIIRDTRSASPATIRVSVDSNGGQASDATDLVAGDTNSVIDAFLHRMPR